MWHSALLFLTLVFGVQCAPKEDEITDLPGLNYAVNFKHYSGYLEGWRGKQLHYWFVESSRNPSEDPVVLWMNGGPGCSSMDGLLTELGPYLISADGTLKKNDFSWNTVTNVIFLEAPACVGFSYDPHDNCTTSDDEVSLSNYMALQDFFRKFPEFKKNDFYITGESYGGIYVPTLAVRILQDEDNANIPLKGFAVGNGLSSYKLNDNSIVFFGYYHGLYGDNLWSSLVHHCCENDRANSDGCNFATPTNPICIKGVAIAMDIVYNEGLNMYNLYGKCLHSSNSGKMKRYFTDVGHLFRSQPKQKELFEKFKHRLMSLKSSDPPCTDSRDMQNYLNNPEVRASIHIPGHVQEWEICSDRVYAGYQRQYENMVEQYKYLTSHVPGLVYNGDVDMACNFLGDEWFVEQLGLKAVERRRMWHDGDQVAGFVKRFDNLDLVTIRGAGHMVPQDKPSAALKMITSFIFKKKY